MMKFEPSDDFLESGCLDSQVQQQFYQSFDNLDEFDRYFWANSNITGEENLSNQNEERYLQDRGFSKKSNSYNTQSLENRSKDSYQKKSTIQHKIEIMLPGESKNLPKCYGRQLQQFIQDVCRNTEDPQLKQLIEDQDIQQFLSIPSDEIRKFQLNKFINTSKGSIFSKEFFGQCLWNFGVVKEAKTNVDVLFRHNIEPFWEVIKKKTKIDQN